MSIRWFGKRGMLWKELSGTVTHAKDRFPPPSLLLIQLGSNDLTEIKTAELVNNITSDILRIKLLFSNAEVIWSEILMRRYWLNANDGKAVELARKRVNLAVKNAVLKEGFCVIRHPNIRAKERNLLVYIFDGTHLSDTGYEIYLNNIQGALEYFLSSDSNSHIIPPE
jgi:lysophospholipase L1-like esterase